MKKHSFHCCAACVHFRAGRKESGGMEYLCSRLGFQTKPEYSFDCFTPSEKVKKLMQKRGISANE
ncbi:hypothetical protein LRR81_04245 [Metabacillus sp. GX 13764]|uniref:hypothetical protein n=1 Tax=Metabacillus kandeliae TaxID=2900151 RepID=UPI001E46E0B6|nr:hypothetical protein [Metabacillus kandeliae]MCD7033430.1 hypothetical protein [Metabacillus kandeliae]